MTYEEYLTLIAFANEAENQETFSYYAGALDALKLNYDLEVSNG